MKNKTFLIILLITISKYCVSQETNCFIEVEPLEFKVYMDSCLNELIFDVRPTDLFKNKKIANAVSVPTLEALEKITDTLDRETPIFVYCVIGMRSITVSKRLCDKNFMQVVSLKGGLENWKRSDLETEIINKE